VFKHRNKIGDKMYNTNEYAEIFNGEGTYTQLRNDLRSGPVLLNWIDQRGTLLQVLFAYPRIAGQGGGPISSPDGDLFVAVMGHGAYAFTSEVHPVYAAEKLGVRGEVTNQRLCDLINAALDGET
jgi:hypothetical protein